MDADEIAYLRSLIDEHKKRLRVLELKAAGFGMSSPAEILIEKSEIEKKIAELEQKIGTTSYQDVAPEIPPELTAGFALRYNRLSTSLKDILSFIENESSSTAHITHGMLLAKFSKYSAGELFYRLEYLYLLSFLEKQRLDKSNTYESLSYCLSAGYRRYRDEEDRLRVA